MITMILLKKLIFLPAKLVTKVLAVLIQKKIRKQNQDNNLYNYFIISE